MDGKNRNWPTMIEGEVLTADPRNYGKPDGNNIVF